ADAAKNNQPGNAANRGDELPAKTRIGLRTTRPANNRSDAFGLGPFKLTDGNGPRIVLEFSGIRHETGSLMMGKRTRCEARHPKIERRNHGGVCARNGGRCQTCAVNQALEMKRSCSAVTVNSFSRIARQASTAA